MKKKILFGFGGAILLGVSTILAISSINKQTLETKAEWSTFESGYHVFGTSYEVPTMTYNYDGKTYTATCIVTYPDKTKTAETKFELNQAGLYTFDYSVNVNDEIHSKTEYVEVDYAQAYISNSSVSSVEYYDSTRVADELNASHAGLYVKLAFGDELKFSKPIYVDDFLTPTKLVEGYIVPASAGSINATQLFIKLTDADNPDIYVTYCYYSHTAVNANGVTAHSSSGMVKSDAQDFFAGVHQTQGIHTNDTYGLWSPVSFSGIYSEKYPGETAYDTARFIMGVEYSEKKVYGTGFGCGKTLDLTLDLDDPSQVTDTWNGFKSNRVFMSIYAESYSAETMDFVINDIIGVSSEDLADNVYFDTVAPEITVLSDYENLPNGAIGYYYPIPEAKAYDQVSLACDVNVEVVYNYFSDDSVNVEIKDNKFYMEHPGTYTIVYTSKDASGNLATLAKTISVFASLPKPSFDLPEHQNSAFVGDFIKVDKNVAISGGVGDSVVNIYYSIGDGDDVLVEGDGFRITKLADYTVTYLATDIIGQEFARSYTISVSDGGLPILENSIVFPKYFISRGYYDFPSEIAYKFENNELEKKDISLLITDDNGQHTYTKEDKQYSPIVNTNGNSVNVKVMCGDTLLQNEDIYTVKNLGTPQRETAINLSNYFIENNFTKTLVSNGVHFTSTNGNASVEYANKINANSFEAIFGLVNGISNNGYIKVTLTDASHLDKSISFKILNNEGLTYFINGTEEYHILNNDLNTNYNQYEVAYRNNAFSVGNIKSTVRKYDDGSLFNGFESLEAYVSISIETTSSSSEFTLNSLCGYSFSSSIARDRIAPVIDINSNYGGTKSINSYYTIEAAYSFDVLSPNVVFTLDVVDPSGEYLTALDGTILHNADPSQKYEIKLTEYGQYYFTLTSIEDSRFLESGNSQIISFYLRVYDDVAPTITFTTGIPSTAKVGSIVSFPKFSVSDNITAKEDLIIQKIILSPTGYYTYLKNNENSMKVTNVGIYRFIIHVIDEAGNFATKIFTVEVTK